MPTLAPEDNPSTPSLEYTAMKPKWDRVNAVLGGLDAMRAAGQSLLPMHERETSDSYHERLWRSRMVNWTEITLDSLVGRPFSDPLKLSPDALTHLGGYIHDIDLLGNDIHTFARDVFRTGVSKAMCHVLVEYPRPTESDVPRTLADDQAQNLRPYLVKINPEAVIFMDREIRNGREFLTEVRIMEEHVARNGFAQVVRHRIRILKPGSVVVYEYDEKASPQWYVVDSYEYDLDFIPMVTYYAERECFAMGQPPIMDLVDLNIAHWQSCSDQVQILTVCRFPMLAASGASDEDNLEVGPKRMFRTSDPNSRVYYVEHKGDAIQAGANDLETLEKQMAGYGAQFLLRRPGRETATARALDSAEATSTLADMTIRFINAMEHVLKYMLAWEGDTETSTEGWVVLPVEFSSSALEAADLQSLEQARTRQDISRETYWAELRRRGILSDDFDPEKEKQRIEDEDPMGMTGTGNSGDDDNVL